MSHGIFGNFYALHFSKLTLPIAFHSQVHSGRVLTEGSPAEIIANPDVRRVYLGEDFRL